MYSWREKVLFIVKKKKSVTYYTKLSYFFSIPFWTSASPFKSENYFFYRTITINVYNKLRTEKTYNVIGAIEGSVEPGLVEDFIFKPFYWRQK